MPVFGMIDDWTHYLYDASGNAVSKDKEVAAPVSFRWGAAPRHLRSHNHGSSFTGLVTGGGRMFHFLDEGTFLFDKGGLTEQWSLVARDAFNGALLWKLPLGGYGQPLFEDVSGQAVPDYIWRTPLSLNRRMVVQGNRLYAALNYREGPLSILDAGTGKTLHVVEVGGTVDEIIAAGDLVLCRVRSEIPMPDPKLKREHRFRLEKELQAAGVADPRVEANVVRPMEILLRQPLERIVAVDAASGRIRWRHDAPLVATQSLAMKDDKVVFHNYQALVCLDAATSAVRWTFENPVVQRTKFGARNLLGNLLLADDKLVWAGSAVLGKIRSLQSLSLDHNQKFTGRGVAALKTLSNLRSLRFGGCMKFTGDGVKAAAELAQLESLQLHHCGVGDDDLAPLAGMSKLKSLFVSSPFNGRLTDAGLKHLVQIQTLESLKLAEFVVTSEGGLNVLTKLSRLQTLELLKVGVSAADIEKLRAAMPKTEIKWTPASDEEIAQFHRRAASAKKPRK